MGLFGGVKSRYKKSEAAVVVQKLLEHQAHMGMFDLDPAMVANRLVEIVWGTKPNIFNGKFGQRPLFCDNYPVRSASINLTG